MISGYDNLFPCVSNTATVNFFEHEAVSQSTVSGGIYAVCLFSLPNTFSDVLKASGILLLRGWYTYQLEQSYVYDTCQ